ncbi:hypothetical protein RSAG8_03960, partial [Rhizoctonia solani AG-8 WAC10335]
MQMSWLNILPAVLGTQDVRWYSGTGSQLSGARSRIHVHTCRCFLVEGAVYMWNLGLLACNRINNN